MGNCLRSQAKVVKIMKMDGKILEYQPSIKVYQVLSDFKDFGVSDGLPLEQYLQPDTELLKGHLYFLVPLPTQSPVVERKKVRFSESDQVEEGRENKSTNIRIKLVLTKQELKEMLESGIVSVKSMNPKLQKDEYGVEEHDDQSYGSKAWKPALNCIPEVD